MLVHGGIGSSPLDDIALLDGTTMTWRTPSTTAASSKDRPEKVWGHSAVEAGGNVWFFGGQQGRKLLDKLYSLNVSSLVWKRHNPSSLPTARAGHSMLSGPAGRVFLFGGQAKKLLNDLWCLEPSAPQQGFSIVQGRGTLPSPRRGQSLVWDGGDYLILFGGTSERGIDAAIHVYSFRRQEWFVPTVTGQGPSPRTQHSAVMVNSQTMLVFGGCNAQGVFFNDTYILDISTWTWTKPQTLNTPPAPRYHHSCVMVNGRCVIYGGVNAKQTFEGLVVAETKVDHDISNIAAELSAMVRPYGPGQSLASGSADVALNPSNHQPAPAAALLPAHLLPPQHTVTSGQGSNLNTGSVDLVKTSTSSIGSLQGQQGGQQHHHQQQDNSRSGHGPPPRSSSSQTAGPSTATAGLYMSTPAHMAALQAQQPVLVVTQQPATPHAIQVPRQTQLNQPSVLVSSLVPATTVASIPADVMQLQLTELLLRRNTEELSNQASQKAAALENELIREREVITALNKELLQLRLLVAEAEAERKEWEIKAKETTLKLNKEAGASADAQAQLTSLQREATSLRQDLAAARSLQDGLVKELGIVTSRYTRLHQHYEAQRKWRTSRQASRVLLGSPGGPGAVPASTEAVPATPAGGSLPASRQTADVGLSRQQSRLGSLGDAAGAVETYTRLTGGAGAATPGAGNSALSLQLLQGMASPLLSSSPEAEDALESETEGPSADATASILAAANWSSRASTSAAGGPSSTPVVRSDTPQPTGPVSGHPSLQGWVAGPSEGFSQLSNRSAPGRQEGQGPLRRRQTPLPLPREVAAAITTTTTSQRGAGGPRPGTSAALHASSSTPGAFGSWLVDSLAGGLDSNASLPANVLDCTSAYANLRFEGAAGGASVQQQRQEYLIGPPSELTTVGDAGGVSTATLDDACTTPPKHPPPGQANAAAAGATPEAGPSRSGVAGAATQSNESFACARLLTMLNAAESARAQVVEKHALLQAAHAALLAEHEDLEALAESAGSLRAAATVAQAERAAALTEVASLRAELEGLQKQVAALSAQVARATGHPDALTSLTLSELSALEIQLETALKNVREATLRRTIEAAAQRVSSEQAACALCLEAPKGTVFNCGHQACSGCASKLDTCPFCRVPITTRIKLFES